MPSVELWHGMEDVFSMNFTPLSFENVTVVWLICGGLWSEPYGGWWILRRVLAVVIWGTFKAPSLTCPHLMSTEGQSLILCMHPDFKFHQIIGKFSCTVNSSFKVCRFSASKATGFSPSAFCWWELKMSLKLLYSQTVSLFCIYLNKTKGVRKTNQLSLSSGPFHKGSLCSPNIYHPESWSFSYYCWGLKLLSAQSTFCQLFELLKSLTHLQGFLVVWYLS